MMIAGGIHEETVAELQKRRVAADASSAETGGASSSNDGLVPPGGSGPMQAAHLNTVAENKRDREVERDVLAQVPGFAPYGLDDYIKNQVARTYNLELPDKEFPLYKIPPHLIDLLNQEIHSQLHTGGESAKVKELKLELDQAPDPPCRFLGLTPDLTSANLSPEQFQEAMQFFDLLAIGGNLEKHFPTNPHPADVELDLIRNDEHNPHQYYPEAVRVPVNGEEY